MQVFLAIVREMYGAHSCRCCFA